MSRWPALAVGLLAFCLALTGIADRDLTGDEVAIFTGTPSDLLPLDLGQCGYEKGSDGKMIQVLTSPDVMRCEFASPGWTVEKLLQYIAEAEPRFHALIDTGALITGLSNEDVAHKLLSCGLGRWCEGVVFLDETDEKVPLATATAVQLPCDRHATAMRPLCGRYATAMRPPCDRRVTAV